MKITFLLACSICLLTADVSLAGADDFADDAYTLPLTGGYAVHRDGSLDSPDKNGKYQLVEMMDPPSIGSIISCRICNRWLSRKR